MAPHHRGHVQLQLARFGGRLRRPRATDPAGEHVAVGVTAAGELTGLDIDPSILVPTEKEVIEDLILAAIKDAQRRAGDKAQQEMARLTREMGLPADMKLPF